MITLKDLELIFAETQKVIELCDYAKRFLSKEQSDLAEDIVFEVAYKLIYKLTFVQENKINNPIAYLKKMIKNACYDYHKNEKKIVALRAKLKEVKEIEVIDLENEKDFEEDKIIKKIISNIRKNPSDYINYDIHGELFEYVFILNLTNSEIAQIYNTSVNNINGRIRSLKKSIRSAVAKKYPLKRIAES